MKKRQLGFTLIEVMIVVAIVAILAGIAYPSYQDHVRKTRRADIQAEMVKLQLNQASYASAAAGYGNITELNTKGLVPSGLTVSGTGASSKASNDYYDITITPVAGTATASANYTITAAAKTGTTQANDGTCTTLTLNRDNARTPDACWAD